MEIFNLERELENFQPYFYRYAVSLTRNHDVALDIVQDVNYSILKNRKKFETHQYPLKISFKFIKNRFISLRRSDKIVYIDPEEQYKIEEEDHIVIYHDYKYILEILNQMDEQSRILIGLLLQEKRYNEIQKILDVKEGTVKSRVHNIRKRIRKLFPEFFE